MKMRLFTLILTIMFCLALMGIVIPEASAKVVTLTWDANTESDMAGYKVYQSATAGPPYVEVGDVLFGTETFDTLDLADGTFFWVVTAYDTSGNESDYSNEVSLIIDSVAPDSPTGLKGFIKQIVAFFKKMFLNLRIKAIG